MKTEDLTIELNSTTLASRSWNLDPGGNDCVRRWLPQGSCNSHAEVASRFDMFNLAPWRPNKQHINRPNIGLGLDFQPPSGPYLLNPVEKIKELKINTTALEKCQEIRHRKWKQMIWNHPTGQLYINPFNHWDLTTARLHSLTRPSSASSISTKVDTTNPPCWTMHQDKPQEPHWSWTTQPSLGHAAHQ